ncbi:MAG: bifunctional 4-hydroxy-2-oxoglutarate aldolase/2-dehydro-3-deoxy-phosphogluconate aldolase [Proteobacteria bacterium]|nr:bifunctional 4-hydroxy-2-oxoglutarate aldolase/2-dehydro-3-deoxy-phosphogluconate aldolase [Pseudomonadota bacterium]
MTRESVLTSLERTRLVPVLRAPSEALAIEAADALVAGGIRVLEVTLTVPNAVSLIRSLAARSERAPEHERPIIGAGTVVTPDEADACMDAGAQFIVSPGLNLALVEQVRNRGIAVMPGALTPSEIITAWQAGADMVKVFPCSAVGGVGYVRSLRGPLPTVKLFPTGGVNLDNAGAYLKAGASALGVGADLVDVTALAGGEPQRLTERARAFLAIVSKASQPSHLPAAPPSMPTL